MKTSIPSGKLRFTPFISLVFSVIAAITFYVSLLMLSAYTSGDQVYYHSFYESLPDAKLSSIPILQFNHTGSAEPIYGFLMWAGANAGFEKNIYISIFNALLSVATIAILIRYRASSIFTLLVFTNFYFLVLLTGAERLKFAYLFLLLATAAQTKIFKVTSLAASAFCHFQSTLIIFAYLGRVVSDFRLRRYIKKNKLLTYMAMLIPAATLLFIFVTKYRYAIEAKAIAYLGEGSLLGSLNIALLLLVSLISMNKKGHAAVMMTICFVLAFLLGENRVNMIAVTLFLHQAIVERNTRHPLIISVMAYFSLKSISFVYGIFEYGDGFADL